MAGFKEFFMDLMGRRTDANGNDLGLIFDDKVENIYSKELAIATCVNLIANAIAGCEIKTFEKGKEVNKDKYFELNIEPNPNENGSQLWHKAIEKMLYEGESLIICVSKQLHVAYSWNADCYPIKGNVYKDIVLMGEDGTKLPLKKTFNTNEVIYLKLQNSNIKRLIDSIAVEYDELLTLAREHYKNLNSTKYKMILDSTKAGKESFQKTFNEKIKSQLSNYMNNQNGLYLQYKGYELERELPTSTFSSNEFIEVRRELFFLVAQAFNIPALLVVGDISKNQNISDLITQFLTFCIDPITDMISKELTRKMYQGYNNYSKGNYILVDTNKIKHVDVLESANLVDKLLSSGILNRNELRDILGYTELEDEFADTYFITKNYSLVENIANEVETPINNEVDNSDDSKGGDEENEQRDN